MRRTLVKSAACAAVLALAACASLQAAKKGPEDAAAEEAKLQQAALEAVQQGGRDCFHIQSISGFAPVNDNLVRIDIGPERAYELLAGGSSCVNLRSARRIALETGPSSPILCVGDHLESAKIHTDQGDECQVEDVRRAIEELPPLLDGHETAAELLLEDLVGAPAGPAAQSPVRPASLSTIRGS